MFQSGSGGGGNSKLDKQLEDAKKKYTESSSELTALKKENTAAEKKIAELEKMTKKLSDDNKKLMADLDDEKAKVMALAEMRDEDEMEDDDPPPKKSRRSSGKGRKSSISVAAPKPETVTPSKTPAKRNTKRPSWITIPLRRLRTKVRR